MAYFSKPKRFGREAPALCARCGTRPGTVLMHFVTGSEGRELKGAAPPRWLCDTCRDEVGRDAADN
jgi:hypothetical protein